MRVFSGILLFKVWSVYAEDEVKDGPLTAPGVHPGAFFQNLASGTFRGRPQALQSSFAPWFQMQPAPVNPPAFFAPPAILGGQQNIAWAPPSGPYRTNERGQFVDTESFARALSDQLGLPLSVSIRLADMTKTFGKQLITTSNAFSDFLGTLSVSVPEPAAVSEPIAAGLEAASSAMQAQSPPQFAAAVPVITTILEMFVTALANGLRLPSDAFLEAPRQEIAGMNDVFEAMLPIVLDSPQSES